MRALSQTASFNPKTSMSGSAAQAIQPDQTDGQAKRGTYQ